MTELTVRHRYMIMLVMHVLSPLVQASVLTLTPVQLITRSAWIVLPLSVTSFSELFSTSRRFSTLSPEATNATVVTVSTRENIFVTFQLTLYLLSKATSIAPASVCILSHFLRTRYPKFYSNVPSHHISSTSVSFFQNVQLPYMQIVVLFSVFVNTGLYATIPNANPPTVVLRFRSNFTINMAELSGIHAIIIQKSA